MCPFLFIEIVDTRVSFSIFWNCRDTSIIFYLLDLVIHMCLFFIYYNCWHMCVLFYLLDFFLMRVFFYLLKLLRHVCLFLFIGFVEIEVSFSIRRIYWTRASSKRHMYVFFNLMDLVTHVCLSLSSLLIQWVRNRYNFKFLLPQPTLNTYSWRLTVNLKNTLY